MDKWSKLGYLTSGMNIIPRKRLIYLIDPDGENDFNSVILNSFINFKLEEPAELEGYKGRSYKNSLERHNRERENYIQIFREINQICVDNETYPLFKDPTNIEECFKTRLDLLLSREIRELNEIFGVDVYKQYPKKYIKPISYPAILEKDKDSDGWNVTVPDIFGGVTCGEDYEDALRMAKDMIKLMLTEAPGQCFPPKTLEETKKNFPDNEVVMIEVDLN